MVERAEARRDVERWFVAHGVPQFVAGYSDEQRLDARATPLIAAWLVATLLLSGTRADWSLEWNVVVVLLGAVYMGAAYGVASWLRGRRPFRRPRTWDIIDIATFGLLPAVPVAVVHGPLEGALVIGRTLLGVLAIYIIIGFGLVEIGLSAVRRIATQLEHIVALVARTLPLLLILVVFLLFAAEIWEAASAMHAGELALLLALLVSVAVLLILTTLRSEIRRIEQRTDWEEIRADARGTPAETLIAGLPATPEAPTPFSALQRTNVTLLMLVNQITQSLFVGTKVALFLVAFGVIALPGEVQERWAGDAIRVVGTFELAGETRTLSAELLIVCAVLGGIVGLYFTGLALTDASYRAEYFARVVAEVERIASVRAVYEAAGPEAEAPAPAGAKATAT